MPPKRRAPAATPKAPAAPAATSGRSTRSRSAVKQEEKKTTAPKNKKTTKPTADTAKRARAPARRRAPAAAAAPAAPASTTTTPARRSRARTQQQQQQQPKQQQPKQPSHKQNYPNSPLHQAQLLQQRQTPAAADTAHRVLSLVLHNRREAARAARLHQRSLFTSTPMGTRRPGQEWELEDDDGEGGALLGAYLRHRWWDGENPLRELWRDSGAYGRKMRDRKWPLYVGDDYDADQAEEKRAKDAERRRESSGGNGSSHHHHPNPFIDALANHGANENRADLDFSALCHSAALVCRAWREVVFLAVDRAAAAAPFDAGTRGRIWSEPTSQADAPLIQNGVWPRFLGEGLRRYDKGALRALMLVVTFPCFQKLALLDLAHALGLVNETQAPKTFSVPGSSAPFEPLPKDEALIRVFGKLKVLRVAAVAEIEHNYNIDGGIMGRQACQVDSMAYFVRPRVASPGTVLPRPRDPPLFRSLVKLQLDDWLEGSNLPWFMNDEISLTFSRANFPVLESLEVELNKRSDRPLRLAYGRGDRDEDDDDDGDGDGGDSANRAILGNAEERVPPPLRRLRVVFKPGERMTSSSSWCMRLPRKEVQSVCVRSLRALGRGQHQLQALWLEQRSDSDQGARGPSLYDGPPLVRLLPGLSACTRLTSLRLDANYDWAPASPPEQEDDEWSTTGPRATWPDLPTWRAAARSLFTQLGPTLRRLELIERDDACRGVVVLPPALSLLSALSSLHVRTSALRSVGPLRHLKTLESLVLWVRPWGSRPREAPLGPWPHFPVYGSDLTPLVRLTHLELSHANRSIAHPIGFGLPSLKCLVLPLRDLSNPYRTGDYYKLTVNQLWAVTRAALKSLREDDKIALYAVRESASSAPASARSALRQFRGGPPAAPMDPGLSAHDAGGGGTIMRLDARALRAMMSADRSDIDAAAARVPLSDANFERPLGEYERWTGRDLLGGGEDGEEEDDEALWIGRDPGRVEEDDAPDDGREFGAFVPGWEGMRAIGGPATTTRAGAAAAVV